MMLGGGPLGDAVEDAPFEGSRLLDFDYLEKFMVDCFVASGTPEKDRDLADSSP